MISYNEISGAWFSDGYHTDEFETLENFVDWLHEHDLYLDDNWIAQYFFDCHSGCDSCLLGPI